MSLRTLAALALVAGGAALLAPGAEPRPAATGAPIVYGYVYADRCPGAGLADVVDRWGMYTCNCTSFVAWALAANHQRVDWFIRGSMDAWNWPHVARLAGLEVDHRASVGAVAVWPLISKPFGHVGYVTGVHADGTIDVAEYNFPGPNGVETFGFDTRSFVRRNGATFIHVPQAGAPRLSSPRAPLRR